MLIRLEVTDKVLAAPSGRRVVSACDPGHRPSASEALGWILDPSGRKDRRLAEDGYVWSMKGAG